MEIAIRNIWLKASVFITAFAVCVAAYMLPDKSHFDQLKYLYQILLIGLICAEYGRSKILQCFLAFTICTFIYISPYKASTDLVSIIIEIMLLGILYAKWKEYFMLRLLNIIVIVSAGYGLLKEITGYSDRYTITDTIMGILTVLTLTIILTIMLFRNAKQ